MTFSGSGLGADNGLISKRRILLCFGLLLLSLCSILLRLGYLQFADPHEFSNKADRQSRLIQRLAPYRGKITDRYGSELAIDVRRYSLAANPRIITEKSVLSQLLSEVTGLSYDFIHSRLTRDKAFVWIKRMLPDGESEELKSMNIRGLEFRPEWKRVYPNDAVAAHVLGFTGIDHAGLEGAEYMYDHQLRGIAGWKRSRKDARQREVISRQEDLVLPVDGYNLKLSLNLQVQHMADKYLAEACEKYKALGGSAVVMDSETGDLIAVSNYPSFDPNNPGLFEIAARRNRAITDVFEPGSVFKMFTVAEVIEEGVAKPYDRLFCENGSYRTGGRILHDVHPYGILSVEEILVKSSNIGTSKLADRLGKKKLHKVIKDLGFGDMTGVDLPGEVRGIFRPVKSWSATSLSSIAMGHEVGVTSVQLAQAISAVVNGGKLMKPRIVMQIESDEKVIKEYPVQLIRRVFSEKTSDIMADMLSKVVEEGTGKRARVEGYKAGGKTGTAQKIEPDGRYSHEHFIASFGGFIELQNKKRYVIIVSVDDPRPQYYGGTVAAPVFQKIAKGITEVYTQS